MATWVYKDGEKALIDALEVGNHLDAGWSVDENPKPKPEPKATKKAVEKESTKKET